MKSQNKMNKISLALKSKTVWTIAVLFLVSGVSAVQQYIPANYVEPLQAVLSFLAIYFKVNPSQNYK